MYIITLKPIKENPSGTDDTRGVPLFPQQGGDIQMDYQMNLLDMFGISNDYIQMNQSMLMNQLVQVPGTDRMIPELDYDMTDR